MMANSGFCVNSSLGMLFSFHLKCITFTTVMIQCIVVSMCTFEFASGTLDSER